MAQTLRTHVSDGSTVLYDVDFDLGYIREEYVYVYQGDHETYETQLSYTWINSGQIQLDSPVTSGETLYIRRVIPRDVPVNDYEDGAVLKELNLDNSFLQTLMIVEEIQDGFIQPIGDFLINSDVDMLLNSIKNLADPVDDTDAMNLQYHDASIQDTIDQLETYVQDYTYTKATIDSKDAATLASANSYAESYSESYTQGYTYAKATIDSKDASTLADAKTYTDEKVLETFVNDSPVNVLQAARQFGDGVNRVFNTPATGTDITANFVVNIDGITQRPTTDYTVNSSGKVVFVEDAPPLNSFVDIAYFNSNLVSLEGVDGVIPQKVPRLTGDGTTVSFSTGSGQQIPEVLITVSIDGILQRDIIDFTCDSGGNIIFSEAPPLDSSVDISWFQPNIVDNVSTTDSVLLMNKYITSDLTIADPYNGLSISPEVSVGAEVTVNEGAEYVVL